MGIFKRNVAHCRQWCPMGVQPKSSRQRTSTGSLLDSVKPNKSKMSGRAMKYPYTLGAKIAQFPFGYYIKNQWLFKYYLLGVGLSVPIFKAFQDAAMSPANVEKWAAKEH